MKIIGMTSLVSGGSEDAIAQIDIPVDGFLVGIDWDARIDLDADGETFEAELSFIATNQTTQNDIRGRISSISAMMFLLTSGSNMSSIQKWLGNLEIAVSAGERLYLHAVSTAGVSGRIHCNLHLDLGQSTRRAARRR